MFDCGWLWLYAGGVLMLLELATSGFIVFFFGLAAAATGICRIVMGEAFGATWQIAAMSAFTILFLAVLRRLLKRIFVGDTVDKGEDQSGTYVGRYGSVVEPIVPPLAGRVEIGDAAWVAVADAELARGQNVRVIGQNNLTLKVEAVKS